MSQGLRPDLVCGNTPGPRQEMRVRDPDGYVLMVAKRDD
jgi:hypothetical protein